MKGRPFLASPTLILAAALTMCGAYAYGQGTATSSLSGVVVDAGGGVIPGAAVVVKNNATNTTLEVVTNNAGAFSLPAINPGTYTVTVTLAGFKTFIVKDVKCIAAMAADLKVTLEVGGIAETVTVSGATELVQTRTTAIASTMNVDQISNLPLPTRNAVNFATLLPGVNTTGINRDSNFNGLPSSATAISLDGVNNNENYNKSTEGLFAMVTPRQDAIEAVTVTTGAAGSDVGGHGTMAINFVTRSGSDTFTGSFYEYHRDPGLNSNYYFNEFRDLGKNNVRLNQYGGRVGGPIMVPKVFDGHGKAFFFFNYEEFRMPNSFSRTRAVLNAQAQAGAFQYSTSSGLINTVDLYKLAQSKGQLASSDPTVMAVLGAINASTKSAGTLTQSSDPNLMNYDFLSPGNQTEKQPTMRFDVNASAKHRVTVTYTHQVLDRNPDHLNSSDVRFLGAPNFRHYVSDRNLSSYALRSVFGSSIVNELRGGLKWGPSYFGKYIWEGPDTFADEGGRALQFGTIDRTVTNWYYETSTSGRSAWSWNLDETFNWQKGGHSLKFGGSYFDGHMWSLNQTAVPTISFGVDSSDPANSMFTTANFPGASSNQLASAKQLYAVLTGRVTQITGNARLDENTGQYVLFGPRTMRLRQTEWGFFAQDLWRVNPQLTVNAGVRWDLQSPIFPTNNIMSTSTMADLCGISGVGAQYGCDMYDPRASGGPKPAYQLYSKGSPGYHTDWNNFAPNIGFAWRPNVQGGIGRAILGDPEQATVRAGFSMAYNREGMALYYGVYSGNQGSTIDVTRNATLGNLGTTPVLLRDESRLGMPSFANAPVYPIYATVNNDVSVFDPNIQVSMGRSISVGLQRAISKDMAVEVRYNGTWGRHTWNQYDLNYGNGGAYLGGGNTGQSGNGEINIVDNGFLNEFKLAQANLQANIAAGRGQTFAYFGPGTGTSPLPIILAYFSAVPAAQSADQAKYTSSLFKDSSFLSALAVYNPQPCCSTSSSTPSFAFNLFNNAGRRQNAINAGLTPNFFLVNPDVRAALIYRSDGWTDFNALQMELRRRFSKGLQFNVNYQFAKAYYSRSLGQRYGLVSQLNTGVPRHALKMTWDYSLPFGRGRQFGSGMNRLLDAIAGGWEFHGDGRIQTRYIDFGNVRLVGMTLKDLQAMYGIRVGVDPNTGVKNVYMLPQDVIVNTIKAFSVSATDPTGYSSQGPPSGRYLAPPNGPDCIQLKPGDCAPLNNYVIAPVFTRFDISLAKKFWITRRANFEIRLDVLNVFDNINFNTPPSLWGSTNTVGQVTTAYTDASNTFDPGGRLGQFGLRFSW